VVQPGPCDLLVVSHACVVAVNQGVYAEMVADGVDVRIVVPSRWRNEYTAGGFGFEVHPGMEGRLVAVRTLGAGRPQRHVHLASAGALLRTLRPSVLFVEEEPFSVAAARWSGASRRAGIPAGVQLAETLDRRLPAVVRASRRRVLADAAFVVARSPASASLAAAWGAAGEVVVVPHGLDVVPERPVPDGTFTVAYVGRLVEEKGIEDLLGAVRLMGEGVRLVVAGDGPLAGLVRAAGSQVVALGPVPHDRIGEVYAMAHVLCVPSRTMPTWEEQFGRVITEAMVRGIPVVATATGEIPWVVGETQGGILVPERDPRALAEALLGLARGPGRALAMGARARAGVLASFTNQSSARTLGDQVARLTPG
jgi:glycosyltransferase involved in cell wall biosynthesis